MAGPAVDDEGKCVACGVERKVGDWYQCPHTPSEGMGYIADEIPGGMVLENGFAEPVTVYSYSEMNRLYKENGLERTERHSPAPGTDKDPAGVVNSRGYMDPYTLNNARILIERQQLGGKGSDVVDDVQFHNITKGVLTKEEAKQAHKDIRKSEGMIRNLRKKFGMS